MQCASSQVQGRCWLASGLRLVRKTSSSARLDALRKRLVDGNSARLASFVEVAGGCSSEPTKAVGSAQTLHPIVQPVLPPLVDSFGRRHTYLRVSLTERCQLRCTYCMPIEGVPLTPDEHLLSAGETLSLVTEFVRLGVTKVRLTGGEPTLRKDLPDLVESLRGLGPSLKTIAMTTNGVRLLPLLPSLRQAGLTHINISLDTLQRDRVPSIAQRPAAHWDRVWAAIQSALDLGYDPVKVNCVVMRGVNDDELHSFVALTKTLPLQVRFIELMPFSGNRWSEGAFLSSEDQLTAIGKVFQIERLRSTDAGETASMWRVPGFRGSFGFISSMTDAFCGTCNRLRLTADGSMKACLHGKEEISLRDILRSGGSTEQLHAAIRSSLRRKHRALGGAGSRYDLAESASDPSGRPMIRIGG